MLDFLQLVIAATVEAVALVLLSRLLFLAGYRLLGHHRWPLFKLLWHLFRLPGNFLHELSHAVVLTLAGFRVCRLRPSLFDPQGTGQVEVRGRLWTAGIATGMISTLGWAAASLAPLAAGIAAIALVAYLFGVEVPSAIAGSGTLGEQLVARWSAVLASFPFSARGLAFVLLVLSIGAELAPSRSDLRTGLPSILVLGAVLCLTASVFYAAPIGAPAREGFDLHARRALHFVMTFEEMALALGGAAAALVLVPYLLSEALAQGELVPGDSRSRRRRAVATGPAPQRRPVRRHPRLRQSRPPRAPGSSARPPRPRPPHPTGLSRPPR